MKDAIQVLLALAALWLVRKLFPRVSRPGRFRFVSTPLPRVPGMSQQYAVDVNLPALPAQPNDVASQSLVLTVNGTAQAAVSIPLNSASFGLGTFNAGDQLSASLTYATAAGTSGPAQVETYTVIDTTVPPQPGAFTFSQTTVPAPAAPAAS